MPDHNDRHDFLAPTNTPPKPKKPHHLDYADPPPTPGERAKWDEQVLGQDPKCNADRRRAQALGGEAHGGTHNGAWAGRMPDATRELVRGPAPDPRDDVGAHLTDEPGIDDDVPDLPEPLEATRLRPRWEAFCRLYAYGHSTADAARHAGYAWDSAAQSGWRLLQNDRVQARIKELQGYYARCLATDDREMSVRAEAIYREAMNRGQYGAAVRALEFADRLKTRHAAQPGEIQTDETRTDENGEDPGGS